MVRERSARRHVRDVTVVQPFRRRDRQDPAQDDSADRGQRRVQPCRRPSRTRPSSTHSRNCCCADSVAPCRKALPTAGWGPFFSDKSEFQHQLVPTTIWLKYPKGQVRTTYRLTITFRSRYVYEQIQAIIGFDTINSHSPEGRIVRSRHAIRPRSSARSRRELHAQPFLDDPEGLELSNQAALMREVVAPCRPVLAPDLDATLEQPSAGRGERPPLVRQPRPAPDRRHRAVRGDSVHPAGRSRPRRIGAHEHRLDAPRIDGGPPPGPRSPRIGRRRRRRPRWPPRRHTPARDSPLRAASDGVDLGLPAPFESATNVVTAPAPLAPGEPPRGRGGSPGARGGRGPPLSSPIRTSRASESTPSDAAAA